MVRITRSELFTSRSRPLFARRSRITTPLQRRVEWMVVQLCVSMMLIQPFDVPPMMWFPSAVKTVTQVECFASCAACFAATAGSISSEFAGGGRKGAEGRIRLTGLGDETSTRVGCSSKREATKSRLDGCDILAWRTSDDIHRWHGRTYWLKGCSSAIYTGASNLTVRTREPSCISQRMHFQSWDELRRYRPFRDQLRIGQV